MRNGRHPTAQTVLADLDLELLFVTEVLKLPSLHYGYWEPGDPLTFPALRRAQARYTETLVELIPDTVKAILDVGTGVGDNAAALATRGYRVIAISPDTGLTRHSPDAHNNGVRFHTAKFEDLSLSDTFDLILMAESHNYFYADAAFAQCRRYLRPGGYLLVSGMFGRADKPKPRDILYCKDDYVGQARQNGFRLVKGIDITASVLPTLEMTQKGYRDYVVPGLGLAGRYLERSAPLQWRILKLLCRRRFRELENLHRYYEERMDPGLFRQNATYERLLFRYADGKPEKT